MGSNGGMERRTRRRVVGAAVIAMLLASGWWLAWLLRREVMVSDSGALPPPPAVAAAGSAEPPAPAPRTREPAPPQPSPAAAPIPAPEQEGKEYRDWSASVAVLPSDLGGVGQSLKFGLDAARNNDMAFCFRDLKRARESPDADAGWVPIRSADLLLYLEARAGAVDVVDAKVARPGTLPPTVLECCREVLRGMEVKVFFAVPGKRYRYIYEIEE